MRYTLKDSEIKELKLLRKNIDARQNIAYIFHVSFGLYNRKKEQILLRKYHFVEKYTPFNLNVPTPLFISMIRMLFFICLLPNMLIS